MIVGFVVVAVEGIGDITATEEASQLATTGTAHSRRIQGGILADGVSTCLLLTSMRVCEGITRVLSVSSSHSASRASLADVFPYHEE